MWKTGNDPENPLARSNREVLEQSGPEVWSIRAGQKAGEIQVSHILLAL